MNKKLYQRKLANTRKYLFKGEYDIAMCKFCIATNIICFDVARNKRFAKAKKTIIKTTDYTYKKGRQIQIIDKNKTPSIVDPSFNFSFATAHRILSLCCQDFDLKIHNHNGVCIKLKVGKFQTQSPIIVEAKKYYQPIDFAMWYVLIDYLQSRNNLIKKNFNLVQTNKAC